MLLLLFIGGGGSMVVFLLKIAMSVQKTLLPINMVLIQNVCQWESGLTAAFIKSQKQIS